MAHTAATGAQHAIVHQPARRGLLTGASLAGAHHRAHHHAVGAAGAGAGGARPCCGYCCCWWRCCCCAWRSKPAAHQHACEAAGLWPTEPPVPFNVDTHSKLPRGWHTSGRSILLAKTLTLIRIISRRSRAADATTQVAARQRQNARNSVGAPLGACKYQRGYSCTECGTQARRCEAGPHRNPHRHRTACCVAAVGRCGQ